MLPVIWNYNPDWKIFFKLPCKFKLVPEILNLNEYFTSVHCIRQEQIEGNYS
jgi:hypothetical protein